MSRSQFMLFVVGLLLSNTMFGRTTLRGKDRKYLPLVEEYYWPSSIAVKEGNSFTRERFELGKILFEDRTINDKGQSCASCHAPYERFRADSNLDIKTLAKYSIVGVGFQKKFIIDGEVVDGLESFITKKIEKSGKNIRDLQRFKIINLDASKLLESLDGAYPKTDRLTEKMANAITVYLRRAIPRVTDFDNWLNGSTGVFLNSAKKGLESFKENCSSCHSGWLFGGDVKELSIGGESKAVRIPSLRQLVTRSGKIIWDPKSRVPDLLQSHLKQLKGDFNQPGLSLSQDELHDLKEFMMGIRVKDLPPF